MDEIFNWFENLFSPDSNHKKIFTGSETHAIIVINDETNSMKHIVDNFVTIFDIPKRQAVELMMRIHTEGIAIVWTGSSIQAKQYLSNLRETGIKSLMTLVL
jgi:ATP-dependent Clp protease adapter protein ClpS